MKYLAETDINLHRSAGRPTFLRIRVGIEKSKERQKTNDIFGKVLDSFYKSECCAVTLKVIQQE